MLATLPATALAARSGWSAADQSQLRLLLTGEADGRYRGGVEILLEPEWYTYWRNPGEAGIAPHFDFSGSENVADVEVLFPAPQRHDDGTSVSLIYMDEVVFPLEITPVDPARPIVLKLDARFGICRDVCVPTGASATLASVIEPEADPLTDARLNAFAPLVPKSPEPGRFEVARIAVEGDTLLIDVLMPESSYSDLFADPPAGWYIDQPVFMSRSEGVTRYSIALNRRPGDAPTAGAKFHFVAVAGGDAIEDTMALPSTD